MSDTTIDAFPSVTPSYATMMMKNCKVQVGVTRAGVKGWKNENEGWWVMAEKWIEKDDGGRVLIQRITIWRFELEIYHATMKCEANLHTKEQVSMAWLLTLFWPSKPTKRLMRKLTEAAWKSFLRRLKIHFNRSISSALSLQCKAVESNQSIFHFATFCHRHLHDG